MNEPTTIVGLDVHRRAIAVCVLKPYAAEPWTCQIANQPAGIRKLVERLKHEAPGTVRCCYEAGPGGYALQRDLLTEVHPPSEDEEAVRDLCRCRDDARVDLMRARHRLNQFLLRHGRVFGDGQQRNWSQAHHAWLDRLGFERTVEQRVFEDYLLNVEQREARRQALDLELETIAQGEIYRERVGWLRCFHGIDTITAMTVLAELHDVRRFPSAASLMAYLGLVPSEASSGEHKRRGGITCAGNRHVRRILIQAAWHHRHRVRVCKRLAERRAGQPAAIVALADRAQRRLCRRFRRMEERNKHRTKIVVAVARELAGFLWAALTTPTRAMAD
jgi:transposase